ncbi:MAG: twin transmembrane helix small protein [Pseudomonadota bacterium]|nr:twin transmembrane helix small protein [Pseudomonadota bacterium]
MIKYIIVFFFFLILISLFSSLFFLIKDKGTKKRAVKALFIRISLSIILFIILIVLFQLGYIEPHGIDNYNQ